MNNAIFNVILKSTPHNSAEADYPHLPPIPHSLPCSPSLPLPESEPSRHFSHLPHPIRATPGTHYKQVTMQYYRPHDTELVSKI
jgi:hypothetical protein